MTIPCHILVGPPSCGKTTFAQQLLQVVPEAQIISTDNIRAELFSNSAIQGPWSQIETQALQQMQTTIDARKPVIYDATNVCREWRMGLLQKLQRPAVEWIAWVLTTPLSTCLTWNQQRERQVPPDIIREYQQKLKQFEVTPAEGYRAVFKVNPAQTPDCKAIVLTQLQTFEKSLRNRQNRYRNIETHAYSKLLDFDRLMHLISLLAQYPGIGSLHQQDPQTLQTILKTLELPTILEPIDEIATVMTTQKNWIYADRSSLMKDLAWLEETAFLFPSPAITDLAIPSLQQPAHLVPHAYSDRSAFSRLMGTIRFIVHHPLSQETIAKQQRQQSAEKISISLLELLAEQLSQAGISPGNAYPMLRKDIENVLHPFGIFPQHTLRKGYYLGTGILNKTDLSKIYQLVHKHIEGLNDVSAIATFERFQERLRWAQYELDDHYPVRAIANSNIVNPHILSGEALATTDESINLEQDIRSGHQIRIGRRKGVAVYEHRPQEEDIWPLQILFHNIGWYLGYEIASGEQSGLFCYERLDRLYKVRSNFKQRSLKAQRQALQQIEILRNHSASLYLGTVYSDQQQFLNANSNAKLRQMKTLDLRFNISLFRFISEGTQRFPIAQTQMSKPPHLFTDIQPDLKQVFRLPNDLTNSTHPYQMKVKLPNWSFEDVTLKAWVLGFGPGVKVVGPLEFQTWIAKELAETNILYSSPNPENDSI